MKPKARLLTLFCAFGLTLALQLLVASKPQVPQGWPELTLHRTLAHTNEHFGIVIHYVELKLANHSGTPITFTAMEGIAPSFPYVRHVCPSWKPEPAPDSRSVISCGMWAGGSMILESGQEVSFTQALPWTRASCRFEIDFQFLRGPDQGRNVAVGPLLRPQFMGVIYEERARAAALSKEMQARMGEQMVRHPLHPD